MMQEALTRIYYISEVDLTDFIYKLHIMCGDYTEDVERNMSSLMKGHGTDLIAVMGNGRLRLGDAMDAYCSTGKIQQTILQENMKMAVRSCSISWKRGTVIFMAKFC